MLQRLRHHTHALSPTEKGMGIITLAMLLIPGMDAIGKLLAPALSPAQIGFVRFAMQTLLLLGFMTRDRAGFAIRPVIGQLMLSGLWIAAAVTFLFWGLIYLPLANNIAIFFVEPLILLLFSAWFLGEKVGRHQYGAVFVGLLGALIVIRPNWEAYGWVTLLPLLAATFYAAHMATLRHLSGQISGLTSQFWSGVFACLFLALAILLGDPAGIPQLEWRPDMLDQWPLLLTMGSLSAIAFCLINAAFKHAPASLLAPFQYLEIISATALGYLLFNDYPDTITWLGTAIILASGLYLFQRERRSRQRLARSGIEPR
ncbi:DMT family transporter [Marinobacterium sediminicola]|uniref:Threonine/homoserine efflux transporter RhtA n=1 Tax=Marinobacterium sediminicola TaxID=518898 RepID=A0ABY1RWB3_9GAMM|nr:DMT family transporter [Marinobacterium sediminicola]ULG70378.1 DMT family transporter [Marinobacterium sediminicola]SMR69567.1 Threonine/homoserine efflux transporter RhtA [Marinobacterium sediminicola]